MSEVKLLITRFMYESCVCDYLCPFLAAVDWGTFPIVLLFCGKEMNKTERPLHCHWLYIYDRWVFESLVLYTKDPETQKHIRVLRKAWENAETTFNCRIIAYLGLQSDNFDRKKAYIWRRVLWMMGSYEPGNKVFQAVVPEKHTMLTWETSHWALWGTS